VDSPASGAFRGVRAAVLGLVCVALGLTGHLVGGGRAPSLWALLILGVPMGAVSLILTSRRRGLPAIGATVAVTQLSLHQALMWLTAGPACAVTGDPHAHLGHGTTAPVLHCASMAGMGAPAGSVHFALGAMLLGHIAAGVVTTLVLAYGESLLWRAWGQIVRLPLGARVPVLAVRRLSVAGDWTPRAARVVAGPARRRGPPVPAPVVG
jgi:hypothetical protein